LEKEPWEGASAIRFDGAIHRGDRGLEDLGALAGAEAEPLAQDQRRALVGRQELGGGDKGELDALTILVAEKLAG
jgi:hypothetical protein